MALLDAAANLCQDGGCSATARRATHERDHTEVAREAAAVLHLDERAHSVEPRIGLDAPDRPDVTGDEARCLLARPGDDRDVRRQTLGRRRPARLAAQPVTYTRAVRARCARRRLTRLAHGLVGHAARVHDRDVTRCGGLGVPVEQESLTDLMRIRVRDLAAQEPDGERRHGSAKSTRARRDRLRSALPHVARWRRKRGRRGSSATR